MKIQRVTIGVLICLFLVFFMDAVVFLGVAAAFFTVAVVFFAAVLVFFAAAAVVFFTAAVVFFAAADVVFLAAAAVVFWADAAVLAALVFFVASVFFVAADVFFAVAILLSSCVCNLSGQFPGQSSLISAQTISFRKHKTEPSVFSVLIYDPLNTLPDSDNNIPYPVRLFNHRFAVSFFPLPSCHSMG